MCNHLNSKEYRTKSDPCNIILHHDIVIIIYHVEEDNKNDDFNNGGDDGIGRDCMDSNRTHVVVVRSTGTSPTSISTSLPSSSETTIITTTTTRTSHRIP